MHFLQGTVYNLFGLGEAFSPFYQKEGSVNITEESLIY